MCWQFWEHSIFKGQLSDWYSSKTLNIVISRFPLVRQFETHIELFFNFFGWEPNVGQLYLLQQISFFNFISYKLARKFTEKLYLTDEYYPLLTNTTATRNQFTPVRIAENQGINYKREKSRPNWQTRERSLIVLVDSAQTYNFVYF